MIQYFVVFVKTKMGDNQRNFSVNLNRGLRGLLFRAVGTIFWIWGCQTGGFVV
ncbi:hypothetical protein BACCAP_02085 [Pseudoflavonifractor capillosus ATCC 29799]|uniref:Uncharacterized protein n=1 Tax=Pseudoflavonifractor capillosus ATCC 29799 TaxID=411467 RepID=A6NV50_9FIRM|nr:hypothetical protein BACCAP_02085 [Pseudoflavonifractor capillosus ATCC 29799]